MGAGLGCTAPNPFAWSGSMADPAALPPVAGDAEIDRCTILHLDMDAFFAAIEVLDAPSLVGLPVIVGGDGPRGVVASCTYEARAYGVRSAMPSVEARRRCPAAVFRPARHDRYAAVSRDLHAILRTTTPVVEPIGLDEAFLDVAGVRRRLGPPDAIARQLRTAVVEGLGLTCAVGVARTKSLAKLASRRAKGVPPRRRGPTDGLVVVLPAEEAAFLEPLPVGALWGVGPATAARLASLGITTVSDLARIPPEVLVRSVGRAAGTHLAALARRQEHDPVVADRPLKSVGRETTLAVDRHDQASLAGVLAELSGSVGDRLAAGGLAGRTVTLKVRFGDRRTITRAATVAEPVDGPQQVLAVARGLLAQVDVARGVRLVGVAVSSLEQAGSVAVQLTLPQVPGAAPAGDRAGGRRSGRTGDRPGDQAWAWWPGHGPDAGGHAHPLAAATVAEPDAEAAEPGRWRQVDGAVVAVRQRFGPGSLLPLVAVPPPPA